MSPHHTVTCGDVGGRVTDGADSHVAAPPHARSAYLFHARPHVPFPLTSRGRLAARLAPFSSSGFPPLFLAGRSFFLFASHCAARYARPHARTLARACTDDRRTHDATCGPQAWLTGSLHDGGVWSVRSPPLRRAPLLAAPIAMPLQCGRPKRPGILFLKLLTPRTVPKTPRTALFRIFRFRELAGRGCSASEPHH